MISRPTTQRLVRRVTFFLALGVVSIALAFGSRVASAGTIEDEVVRLAVRANSGLEARPALRALLGLWDLTDPAKIEETITARANDAALDPALRAYATWLLAEARERRGDYVGAQKARASLGFVDKFLILGPFDDENRIGITASYAPETELGGPIVPGKVYDGKERPVRWRDVERDPNQFVLDFGNHLRPRDRICGYATTFIRAKDRARKVSLFVGVEGAFKLYWGKDLALSDEKERGFDVDRFATTVTLGTEFVRLTVKVCSANTAPKLALRIADPKGAPDLGVEVSADPRISEKLATPGKAETGPLGAIQAFDKATTKQGKAEDLEAYARYLAITGGDPAGEHKARELAQRAADGSPTIDRLLLAGDLTEDRNQRRAWVDKAKAKLTRTSAARDRISVAIAEARHIRGGVYPRDAVPLYDSVLRLDPDHPLALLGRVELYVQAGLPRTALATLSSAVERSPRSVALLRSFAQQLRLTGRDTEASETDRRWFQLRGDDTGYIAHEIDQAVASRRADVAIAWLEKLHRVETDRVFREMTAAKTHRGLGRSDQAKRALERALELAPDDVGTLRALADAAGAAQDREGQLRHLRKILALYPQTKEVRAYVEALSPPRPRQDEAYAWDKEKIASLKPAPERGIPKRTLRNLSVTTVFPNGLASRFKQVIFQPLSDEGAASARQFAFGYQADRQEVELRLARVYRADGTIAEAIESGEAPANDPSIAMYTSARTFYVQFPRLNPGDIVELRYRIEDVALRNEVADHFDDVEYLQSDDPIAESEYVLIAPKTRKLHTLVSNLSGVEEETKESGDLKIYRFFAKNVPAIKPEPAMPAFTEVAAQVHVSTFATWEELGAWYWNLARDQFDVDDEVRKKVAEISKGLTTEQEKVKAVYRYVTGLRYVALEFGIEGIKPRRCALTLARGWGDCKDKATMIVTMLRELGIASTIVIVRTGMRGDLPKNAPPSISAFDHAIAYVPSLDLYLDGTADGAGSNELPTMDRGSVALQINQGKAKLVRLPDPPKETSVLNRNIDLTLSPEGAAQFTLEANIVGAHAASWRARYHADGTRRDRAANDLASLFGPVELDKGASAVTVKDDDDVEKPLRIAAKGRANNLARREGDAISVPVATNLGLMSSYASLSQRQHAIVVGALTTSRETRTITLPPSLKVKSLPTRIEEQTPFGDVSFEAVQTGNKVVIKSSVSLKKSRVTPAEYAGWKTFCQTADSALGQRVVLGP